MNATATPTRKLDLILPHILALKPYVEDPTVTEIMVNRGGREVYIERAGRIEHVAVTVESKGLDYAITKIARFCQNEADPNQPMVEARLEDDGSRVAVVLPPCSPDGATMTIRKFGRRYSLTELVEAGSVPATVAQMLRDAIATRRNILIAGSTGSGKTSLLNAVANLIPAHERIVVIEDTTEIEIDRKTHHVVRLQSRRKLRTRPEEAPVDPVSIDDLLRAALRHRPDRIILGEVRGAEAYSLLQAMNSGHKGSLSTLHSNSAAEALTRLTHLVLESGIKLPYESVQEAIGLAINLVVHLDLDLETGQRRVGQVMGVRKYDRETKQFVTDSLYQANQ
jgi:pilus assembly protein CpaF